MAKEINKDKVSDKEYFDKPKYIEYDDKSFYEDDYYGEYHNPDYKGPDYDDGRNIWLLLGLVIPILGILLFFMWRKTRKVTARKCLIGALIRVVCEMALFIGLYIIFF